MVEEDKCKEGSEENLVDIIWEAVSPKSGLTLSRHLQAARIICTYNRGFIHVTRDGEMFTVDCKTFRNSWDCNARTSLSTSSCRGMVLTPQKEEVQ